MKKSLALMLIMGATGALAVSMPAAADSVAVPVGQQGEKQVDTPNRGLNKSQVAQRYGEPASRKAPVGDPPISRWVYNGYTVYFEKDYVIHAVRHPNQ
ncbi:MAG: hypothetical protein R3208_21365 [Ketobacteraceae bacterium]|nr:hypothetical protein [Ketobacteraceae bacterium]